jgi:methylenetetrahydrofolate dehydrogenase (NADP+)/methenyltetrahydrofolate cyclohydrolase
MTLVFDGHVTAQRVLTETAKLSNDFREERGRAPRLALLVMGAPAPALTYASRIEALAEKAGVEVVTVRGAADSSLGEMAALIKSLNEDASVDGILPLTPFPPAIGFTDVADLLSPEKDVDGLTPLNAGQLASGRDGLFPCTPQGAVLLAEDVLGDLRGVNATVVGASAYVGRPLAQLLLQRGVTVTIAHIDTRDLPAACKSADLLFVAVGKAGLIDARHVREGATVVDIGINAVVDERGERRIVGDVDLSAVQGVVRNVSAVPDGVGPVTTAFLLANTVRAATQRATMAK